MKGEVSHGLIWATIVGMAVLNFAVRFPPLAIVSRMRLPKLVARWLSFIPIAVMGALVASEVLTPDGVWANPMTSPSVYAAIITALTFRLTKSFLGASVAGMASFVVLQHAMPVLLR